MAEKLQNSVPGAHSRVASAIPEGLLLVNKPSGPTSHDVVALVRHVLAMQRIGHTGTLDPMAEGLLVLLVGRATQHQQELQGHEKCYEATLRLGIQTDTGDLTGKPVRTAAVPSLDHDHLSELLQTFHGTQSQTPPIYSAVKVRGRPSYWWARHRTPVALSPRQIHLSALSLITMSEETLTFRVHCSAGTYIRTLGESIADQLGTVGHLTRLVRLSIASWRVEDAVSTTWIAHASSALLAQKLLSVGPSLQR